MGSLNPSALLASFLFTYPEAEAESENDSNHAAKVSQLRKYSAKPVHGGGNVETSNQYLVFSG